MRKMPQYTEALEHIKWNSGDYEVAVDTTLSLDGLRVWSFDSIISRHEAGAQLSYWKQISFEVINPATEFNIPDLPDIESAIYFQLRSSSGNTTFYAIKYNPQYTRWEWWKQGQPVAPQSTLASLFDSLVVKTTMGYSGNSYLKFKWSQQYLLDEDITNITVYYKNALFGTITLPVNTNFSV